MNRYTFNTDISSDGFIQANLVYELMAKVSDDYMFLWDLKNDNFRITPNFIESFNLPSHTLSNIAMHWQTIIHPNDVHLFVKEIEDFITGKIQHHDLEYRIIDKNGEFVWITCRGLGLKDDNGVPILMAGSISNISDAGKKNKFDHVTGVFSRYKLELDIQQILNCSEKNSGYLMLLGVDNFKSINETYGHTFGDSVLHNIAKSLLSLIPNTVQLYRLGGDEFVLHYPNATEEDVALLFNKIKLSMNISHVLGKNSYCCTLSGGATQYPLDGENCIDLLKYADSAMDQSKAQGKNTLSFFSISNHFNKIKAFVLEDYLRQSVENNFHGFELHYQPQISIYSTNLAGAEALLRWSSASHGNVSPVDFIPILEQTGLIIQVGEWIIKQAFAQCKQWQKILPDFKMSINLSYIQIAKDDFEDLIALYLKEFDLNPNSIILELTETCWAPDLKFVQLNFKKYRDIGIKMAIDDFGTGYSSLNYLKNLPLDVVKIDRCFVTGIKPSSYQHIFIESIINIAKCIGLKICVEGVETKEEYDTIKQLAPDYIQGYFFAKPHSSPDFYDKFIINKEYKNALL